ncbi:MAG: ABC transporter permease [Lachnospiraceae bacterium]|nr:ABC transporter permease [Lachnospiraceae bacterium]
MKGIYKRELKSYFYSMIGYVFIAFLVAFVGIYFMAYNLNMGYPYFSYTLSGGLFILLIAIPILTMKSFSEERRSKTDQLLLTAPVTLGQIVWGKYLAMVTVFALPNLIFCLFPLMIKASGQEYFKVDYCAILAYFLLGCAYIAVGMFLSSLTESQIIAAISTFGVLLVLYLWNGLVDFLPTDAGGNLAGVLLLWSLLAFAVYQMAKNWILAVLLEAVGVIAGAVIYFLRPSWMERLLPDVLGQLSLSNGFTSIVNERLLDVSSLFLGISVIVLFVFLTMQTIQRRRWS